MGGTKTMGNILTKMRKDKNITQIQIARRFGWTSAQFVSNWERGTAPIPASAIPGLASMFDVSIDTLEKIMLEAYLENMRARYGKLKKSQKGRI